MDDDQWSLVADFLRHLAHERRLSPRTVEAYDRDLTSFGEFCTHNELATWAQIETFHVRRFAAESHAHGLHPRSIQRRLSGLRSFFKYLVRENRLNGNPATDVSSPQTPRRLPDTLDADQMARLLAIPVKGPADARDRAMLELLYSSGLRRAELVGLDVGDIDLADGLVTVTGRGSKTRVVPVGRIACEAVRDWLRQRPLLAAPNENGIFVGVRGKRINPRTVQARVKHWAKQAGMPQRVYPHLFRHSFATHMLESSGDLRGVQELLGHADISSRQFYTHLDFQQLAQIYDKAHPRARRDK